ncbi:hypothetical protein BDQ12DRAFT_696601 [Crucibulum laeve]|uniref:Uncharacterized protein n=1 Tax=Crucibulum laeve TaxID=68775 RepID=A0A5C3MA17_9AGAR|nr:hypothetical protein BDQ12DRAFT_696601 [Crucibulum laeve]
MLCCPGEGTLWESYIERPHQPHDIPTQEPEQCKNYFSAVIIALTKFDKSESLTKILAWLEEIYPTEASRPAYICIDKACLVLRSAVVNGDWDDVLCCWWCNPAPANGSAPNLVVGERDNNGNLAAKRAFNTQACEQLNSWLGGFESILKRMTQGNFNWFIHTMLFYHIQYVIQKQQEAQKRAQRREERAIRRAEGRNNDDEDSTGDEEDNL